jgi:hypothetical protein
MSLSTTAGHVPRSALKLLRAQTTTSVSELEPHIQAAPEDHIQENTDIVEQSNCQVADRGPPQCRR